MKTFHELKTKALDLARGAIQDVLSQKANECQILCLAPDDVMGLLIELGAESEQDMETNGWEWDYWETWIWNNKTYQLSGSGFYGQVTFSIKE